MKSAASPPIRILVIDDNQAIHQDFRKILVSTDRGSALDEMEAALFGEPLERSHSHRFEVDTASQGEEGVGLVRAALQEGRPYALAFVDVRMPPGIDGVETTSRLWEVDGDLQVVLCSAYTDYSWEQMAQRLGVNQRLLILRKPFDSTEVRQMAHALAEKWELLRRDRSRLEDLSRAVDERTRDLEAANVRLRQELEERARLESQLAQAQKLEALGRLAAGLAHEVSNPLSFVISNLNHIRSELKALEGGPPSEQLMELWEACRDALMGTERIHRVVQDVKVFARMGERYYAPVEVRTVLEQSLAMVSDSLTPGIQVVRDFQEVPLVRASEHGLGQVFLNLLINASHALAGVSQPCLRVATRLQEDGRVRVEVQDNGRGIAPEHLGRIFEPFFTTKPVGVGTGLGLAICHGIITGLGGDITVESTPGQGATFCVLLPQAPYESSQAGTSELGG